MATGGDVDDLIAQFKRWNGVSKPKDPNKMTNQAWGKCVQDCIGKDTTTKQRMDSSVWPYVADKSTKTLDLTNKAKVNELMDRVAKVYKEIKKSAKSEDEIRKDLCAKICSASPDVKVVKTSKTGNVGGLTDTTKYTGAHKERFDDTGKGKGIDGREYRHDDTGYVTGYKGDGTFEEK